MTKLEEVNNQWESLRNLTQKPELKLTEQEIVDQVILINHYQALSISQARDYDAQIQVKEKYEKLNEWDKVAEIDREIAKISFNLQPLEQTRERLRNNLENYKNSNLFQKCPCDISSLEKQIVELNNKLTNFLNIPLPSAKEPKKLDEAIPPTKSAEELELAQEQLEKKLERELEEIKNKELQELKDEVGKLSLNDLEKVLLKESEDKEHIEAIRNQAQTRIDKELKEKQELEKEAKEQAEAEQKEKERLIQEQAEKERMEKEAQELTNLKKEVELLNPNPTEKELLTNAPDKTEVEKIRTQINDRLAKEKAERDKWVKEFQNFKTEIEKLGLNANEQKQLDDAIDKWQAEKVKSDAEARISQEQAEKEWAEKVRLNQETEELNKLKTEIGKLTLTIGEKELLKEAPNKEKVEILRTQVETRIAREEMERKERERIAQEQEKQKQETLLKEQERLYQEQAEKQFPQKEQQVFDGIFSSIKTKLDQTSNILHYTFSDLENDNFPAKYHGKGVNGLVLYKCRINKMWGVFIFYSTGNYYWMSPGSQESWVSEIEEIKRTALPSTIGTLARTFSYWFRSDRNNYFEMNEKNSVRYSLMWSLAFAENYSEEFNGYLPRVRLKDDWIPQMALKFRQYGV